MDDGADAHVRVLHVDDDPRLAELVSLYLEREAGDADLSVATSNAGADDGPGIPAADRDAVFEHGHTTSDSGSGFGLSIVQRIVEARSWSIHVGDPDPDLGGARFEVDVGVVDREAGARVPLGDD